MSVGVVVNYSMFGGFWCTASCLVGFGVLFHFWWVWVYYFMFGGFWCTTSRLVGVGFPVYNFMSVGVVVYCFMFGGS